MRRKSILITIFTLLMVFIIGSVVVNAAPITVVMDPDKNTSGHLEYVSQNENFNFYITKEDINRIVKSTEYAETGNFEIRVFQEFTNKKNQYSLKYKENLEKVVSLKPQSVIAWGLED